MSYYVGFLVVFRANNSYDRFTEGLRAIAQMGSSSKTLMTQFNSWIGGRAPEDKDDRSELHRLLVLYFCATKKMLHGKRDLSKSERLIATDSELDALYQAASLKPDAVLQWIRLHLWHCVAKHEAAGERNLVGTPVLTTMDGNLTVLADNLAVAFRVAFTPMPFPYAQLIKWSVLLYVTVSPFAYVAVLGNATPAAAFVFAMLLYGLEEVGVEIEGPFGKAANDLTLKDLLYELDEDLAGLVALANGDDHLRLLIEPSHRRAKERADKQHMDTRFAKEALGRLPRGALAREKGGETSRHCPISSAKDAPLSHSAAEFGFEVPWSQPWEAEVAYTAVARQRGANQRQSRPTEPDGRGGGGAAHGAVERESHGPSSAARSTVGVGGRLPQRRGEDHVPLLVDMG
jgi:putative membrane protein